MMKTEMVGKAQSVLGPIAAEYLGMTLPHEHLLWDLTSYFVEPIDADEKVLADKEVRPHPFLPAEIIYSGSSTASILRRFLTRLSGEFRLSLPRSTLIPYFRRG